MFLDQVVNGLSIGSLYAIIAAGVALIYYVLRIIEFSHGELVMIGAYAGLFALQEWDSVILALIAALVVGAVFGLLVERLLLRPLRGQGPLPAVLVNFGLILVIRETVRLSYEDGRPQRYPFGSGDPINLLGLEIRPWQLAAVISACVVVAALELLLSRTRVGVKMRATAENLGVARGMGIRVNRVAALTVALASALAAGAGVLVGILYGQTSPYIGSAFGLKAVAVVLFAGSGRIVAAMIGGVLIGLTEALSVAYLSSTYRELFVWVLIAGILLVRPRGLFPRPEIARV